MLTEQDILGTIQKHIGGFNFTGKENAAKAVHNQHLAECERIAELAFNAARETKFDGFFKSKYPTYQDYKDNLKNS